MEQGLRECVVYPSLNAASALGALTVSVVVSGVVEDIPDGDPGQMYKTHSLFIPSGAWFAHKICSRVLKNHIVVIARAAGFVEVQSMDDMFKSLPLNDGLRPYCRQIASQKPVEGSCEVDVRGAVMPNIVTKFVEMSPFLVRVDLSVYVEAVFREINVAILRDSDRMLAVFVGDGVVVSENLTLLRGLFLQGNRISAPQFLKAISNCHGAEKVIAELLRTLNISQNFFVFERKEDCM